MLKKCLTILLKEKTMLKKCLPILLAAAVLAAWTTSASAETIVFSDNFDNVTNGTAPSAQTGSWHSGSALVDNTYASPPSGSQYLDVNRPDVTDRRYGALSTAVTQIGDQVHAEFYIYSVGTPAGVGLMASATSTSVTDTTEGLIFLSTWGGVVKSWDGDSHEATTLTYTANTWQKWEIDYTVGDTDFDVTIAGGSTVTVSDMVNPGGQVKGIFFTTAGPDADYGVDSALVTVTLIPEPSTIVLLGLGVFGLIGIVSRRKKR